MSADPHPSSQPVDRLVVIAAADEQAGELGRALIADGFRFTVISASSGLLPAGTTCLLAGIAAARGPRLLGIVESICRTRLRFIPTQGSMGLPEGLPVSLIEAEVGSATVYMLAVEACEEI